jgi:hypothetical protein
MLLGITLLWWFDVTLPLGCRRTHGCWCCCCLIILMMVVVSSITATTWYCSMLGRVSWWAVSGSGSTVVYVLLVFAFFVLVVVLVVVVKGRCSSTDKYLVPGTRLVFVLLMCACSASPSSSMNDQQAFTEPCRWSEEDYVVLDGWAVHWLFLVSLLSSSVCRNYETKSRSFMDLSFIGIVPLIHVLPPMDCIKIEIACRITNRSTIKLETNKTHVLLLRSNGHLRLNLNSNPYIIHSYAILIVVYYACFMCLLVLPLYYTNAIQTLCIHYA